MAVRLAQAFPISRFGGDDLFDDSRRNTYAQAKDDWRYAGEQGEYGEKLNNLTKVVASSNLDDARWGDLPAATVTRDPAATIRELKEQSGKDIWLWGSLKLMHSLLDAGVVDEVRMLVCPASRGKEGAFSNWQDSLGVQPKCNRRTGG